MFSRKLFSDRLKELRKSNNIRQKELGDIIGISESAVSYLEKGKRSPSIEAVVAIADYFGVSLDYLVGRSDNPRQH